MRRNAPLPRSRVNSPDRPSLKRVLTVLAATLMASSVVIVATPASAQGNDSRELAAQVDRIVARRADLGEKISVLEERANLAKAELVDIEARSKVTEADVSSAEKSMKDAQGQVKRYAVRAFTGGLGTGNASAQDNPTDAIRSRTLLATAQGNREQAVEEVRAARSDLSSKQELLDETAVAKATARERIESSRAEMKTVEGELAASEAQVKGDLAEALEREERQRCEAERAEAERRQAEAEAQAQAESQAEADAQVQAQAETAAGAGETAAGESAETEDGESAASSSGDGSGSAADTSPAPTPTAKAKAKPKAGSAAKASPTSKSSAPKRAGAARAVAPAPKPTAAPTTRAPRPTTTRPTAPPPTTPRPVAPPPPPPPPPPPSSSGQRAVQAALSMRGTPYRWGGQSPGGFDCSGLVLWAYAQAGRGGLPHSSRMQVAMGRRISVGELVPGDLVAYGSPVHHIGIYIGGGQYVHAPRTGDVVKVASIYRFNGTPIAVRI